MSLRLGISTALLCSIAVSASAQQPRYHLTSDTLRYQLDNPFRMYWVRGGDTIGPPQHEWSVEAQRWNGSAEHPIVISRDLLLNVNHRIKIDTFSVAPNGRVITINHHAPLSTDRVDLLMQLPTAALRKGASWTDTVSSAGTDPGGAEWYEVIRSYHVRRLVDTMDAHGAADVVAEGRIRMRYGFWVDSIAGKAAWVDIKGPVTEQYLFDVAKGRLLHRSWSMDLRGRGVSPAGADTVDAGLRSEENITLASSPRTRFLLAPLPGSDTSVTFKVDSLAALLLHVVDRSPERITASLARNDGLVGVASVELRGTNVLGYHATWADTASATTLQSIRIRKDSLVLTRSGRPDTTTSLPKSGPWGVADYGMEELLAPMLLSLPRDSVARPIAVFRPYPGHWDSGTALVQMRGGLVLVAFRVGDKNHPQALLFTPDGDLLFGQIEGTPLTRRVPVDAVRLARLKAAATSAAH